MKINRITVEIPLLKSNLTIEKDLGEWNMHCTYPEAQAGQMFDLWMLPTARPRYQPLQMTSP